MTTAQQLTALTQLLGTDRLRQEIDALRRPHGTLIEKRTAVCIDELFKKYGLSSPAE